MQKNVSTIHMSAHAQKYEEEYERWLREEYGDAASYEEYVEREWMKINGGEYSRFDYVTIMRGNFGYQYNPLIGAEMVQYILREGSVVYKPNGAAGMTCLNRMDFNMDRTIDQVIGYYAYIIDIYEDKNGGIFVMFNSWNWYELSDGEYNELMKILEEREKEYPGK